MEFRFRRKYTGFFIFAVVLHLLVLAFWLFFPSRILESTKDKAFFTLLALINVELILLLCLGLFRRRYFAYFDKLVIKRSLIKNVTITYGTILNIKEKPHDSILFGYGLRPSFKITYIGDNGKKKKINVRCDNTELLLKVVKNEIDISKIK